MTKTGAAATPALADEGESFGEWLSLHTRQVTIGAIAVVAIGLVVWFWRGVNDKKEREASRSLAEAELAFGSGNSAMAQSELLRVVRVYKGTAAEQQARLLLAQTYFDQKKVSEGLKVLDEAGNPKPFAASYHAVRAAGLEQAGKPAEAAAEYLRAAQEATNDADKSNYKGEAARAFQDAKQTDQARKIWSELAADETNPMAGEARIRLGELSAKPAAKT